VPEPLVTETKVAGREVTPGDVASTERLNRYWTEGAGAAKIRWGVPGDFDRCTTLLSKYIHDPEQVKGHCANLHKRATGGWPGHAPGVEEAEAAAKKGAKETKAAKVAERAGMSLADVVDLSELGDVEVDDPVFVDEADMPEIADTVDMPDGGALLFSADRAMLHRHPDGKVELIHGPVEQTDVDALPEVSEPDHVDLPLTAEAPADGDAGDGDDADGDDKSGDKTAGDKTEDEGEDEGGSGEKAMPGGYLPCPVDKSHSGVKDGRCAECGAKLAKAGGSKAIEQDDDDDAEWGSKGLLTALDLMTRGYDDAPVTEVKKNFSAARREELAKSGAAMEDGSFPIENEDDLDNAVSAIGRAGKKGSDRYEKVKRHIKKRAKALGATDRLPDEWTSDSKAIEGKIYPYLPGSVEERQAQLQGALNDALLPDEDDDATSGPSSVRGYVSLDATFADYCVATVSDYSGPVTDQQSYQIPYVVDDDGAVTLGTPTPVDKVVSIVPDTDDVSADLTGPSVPLQGIGLAVKALTETISGGTAPGLKPRQVQQLKTAHAALTSVMSDLGLQLSNVEPSTAPDANATVDGPGSKSLIPEAELLATEALFADL